MRLISLLVFSLSLLLAACQSNPQPVEASDSPAVVDTLASLSRQFSEAYMKGDVATMVALYTEEAVLFPNNTEYIRGKEAIEQYWTLPEGRRITHHKMTAVAVEVSGTMASDFGHYEVSGENGDQAWGPVYGKYVVVWKRGENGQWRMHLDMWNSRPSPEE